MLTGRIHLKLENKRNVYYFFFLSEKIILCSLCIVSSSSFSISVNIASDGTEILVIFSLLYYNKYKKTTNSL